MLEKTVRSDVIAIGMRALLRDCALARKPVTLGKVRLFSILSWGPAPCTGGQTSGQPQPGGKVEATFEVALISKSLNILCMSATLAPT